MKTPSTDLHQRLLAISDRVLGADTPPSIEDIANQVGMSRASLYYYFSGQDDLIGYLLRHHAEQGAAAAATAVDDAAPARTRLRQMLTGMARYLGSHPGTCSGLLRAAGDAQRMAGVLQVNDELIAQPLRSLLEEGHQEGSLGVGDVAMAADAAIGAVLMAVLGAAARGADPSTQQFVDRVVDQVVDGLTARA